MLRSTDERFICFSRTRILANSRRISCFWCVSYNENYTLKNQYFGRSALQAWLTFCSIRWALLFSCDENVFTWLPGHHWCKKRVYISNSDVTNTHCFSVLMHFPCSNNCEEPLTLLFINAEQHCWNHFEPNCSSTGCLSVMITMLPRRSSNNPGIICRFLTYVLQSC